VRKVSASKKSSDDAGERLSDVEGLYSRVTAILDRARNIVVRTVNNEMVLAYWHIGREIVAQLQDGKDRASYGQQILADLSVRLTQQYGEGFSVTNLRYIRQFYTVYADRSPEIHHLTSDESESGTEIEHKHRTSDVLGDLSLAIERTDAVRGFSPGLTWTHYRTLTTVDNKNERLFYEIEAEKAGWSVVQLQRQIHTMLFSRLMKSQDKAGVLELATRGQVLQRPVDSIRDPYVLDFLNLPDGRLLHESDLESAIIAQLQEFLLELGKGFAFVARQKRLSFEDTHLYVDLVFYNWILKCFLLIDLKIGKLTHQDVGQMDGYVRMFDDQVATEGDNPTIGLILCAEKNEAVAKYSVLSECQQIFAAKYLQYLPTEEELQRELQRERRLIEASCADGAQAE
jgi:predicted nuclease of restriction endonuclease-like (RecB) superfamily